MVVLRFKPLRVEHHGHKRCLRWERICPGLMPDTTIAKDRAFNAEPCGDTHTVTARALRCLGLIAHHVLRCVNSRVGILETQNVEHRDWTVVGSRRVGYLTLGGAIVLDGLDLPDPDDEQWAHLLIEAARVAGHDRPAALHEHADGVALLDAIRARRHELDHERASNRTTPAGAGDTTYLCTAEVDGLAVSLIQSNASGFGSWLVEPSTGINLHNRGLGFSLAPGHPAEFGPGRRPPHTLSPALATRAHEFVSVFGTMGGEAQPQILLQIAARLFHHRQSPTTAINAARWALAGPRTGFDTWDDIAVQGLDIEGHAPADWAERLTARGHRTSTLPAWDSTFGHAHAIMRDGDGLAGAADPRTRIGAVIGR